MKECLLIRKLLLSQMTVLLQSSVFWSNLIFFRCVFIVMVCFLKLGLLSYNLQSEIHPLFFSVNSVCFDSHVTTTTIKGV